MKLKYLKSVLKFDSFDVTIGIKIPMFRVSITTEPGRSLLQFVTTNCLIRYNELFDIWLLKLVWFLTVICTKLETLGFLL